MSYQALDLLKTSPRRSREPDLGFQPKFGIRSPDVGPRDQKPKRSTQNPAPRISNGAIWCKLWPKTILDIWSAKPCCNRWSGGQIGLSGNKGYIGKQFFFFANTGGVQVVTVLKQALVNVTSTYCSFHVWSCDFTNRGIIVHRHGHCGVWQNTYLRRSIIASIPP